MQSEAAPTIFEIPSAATISEGFEKYANAAWYSVCRSTSEGVRLGLLPVQGESCSGKALYVYAWNSRLEKVFDLTVSVVDAMEQWERDELKLSFIDAPISKFVPNEGIHKDLRDVGMNEDNLDLVLTNVGTYTPFHQDPVAGIDRSGSGWQWLERGKKLWNFLAHEH